MCDIEDAYQFALNVEERLNRKFKIRKDEQIMVEEQEECIIKDKRIIRKMKTMAKTKMRNQIILMTLERNIPKGEDLEEEGFMDHVSNVEKRVIKIMHSLIINKEPIESMKIMQG